MKSQLSKTKEVKNMAGFYKDLLEKKMPNELEDIQNKPRMTKKEQRIERYPDNRTYC